MKALLVVDSEEAYRLASFFLTPLGFELVRYRLPLKAIDNLEEIDPDAVLISAEDFPRHWKPLVHFIRTERDKARTTVILLKGANFSYEDAAKASFLGVNGIASEDLDDPEEIDRVQSILARYKPVKNDRSDRRVKPARWDRLEFVLSAPDTGAIVPGRLSSISISGLAFEPESPEGIARFPPGTVFPDCSLRVDDAILSVSCSLVRTSPDAAFVFTEMEQTDRDILDSYLAKRPQRELRALGTCRAC